MSYMFHCTVHSDSLFVCKRSSEGNLNLLTEHNIWQCLKPKTLSEYPQNAQLSDQTRQLLSLVLSI